MNASCLLLPRKPGTPTGCLQPYRIVWPFAAILLLFGSTLEAEGPPASTDQKTPTKPAPDSISLFDGKTLGKWQVIDKYDFGRHGKVYVKDGRIIQKKGRPATGIRWTGPFPKIEYEVTLEAMRVEGTDFFCGMTFPVGKSALTLVLGGWGGSIVGLSSIDGEPAVENETCAHQDFEQNRWYRVRLRVTGARIQTWIDEKQVIDLPTADREFTIYWEMEPALPFGIATWYTTGALRDLRVRRLKTKSAEHP